ncbi:MAG TPA: hypothetical protein VG722_08885, partial [Tepidisphaeraceae bacterium]|nr:hypothetical protein [Tepidisphaeraceae bacterium]
MSDGTAEFRLKNAATPRLAENRGSAFPIDADAFVMMGGVEMYRISGFDRLPPFMMTLTSASDHWMYVSSYGGLTAGRRDAEHALFPYETEDRLNHAHGITGPLTMVRLDPGDGRKTLWEPLGHRLGPARVRRNIYKTVLSDRVVFEEIHDELDLTFRYQWACSEQFGFVRTVTLINNRPARGVHVEIVDGLLNILPANVPLVVQQTSSCLADAYKRCEWDESAQLAIFSLSSLITDRPEPGESLRANIAWSRGLTSSRVLMSEEQLFAFRQGRPVTHEDFVAGKRGAFLVASEFELPPGMQVQWDIVADLDQSHIAVEKRRQFLRNEKNIRQSLRNDINATRAALIHRTTPADALQLTGDFAASAHHAANVLFNSLRGGIPVDAYTIESKDFSEFLQKRNVLVA